MKKLLLVVVLLLAVVIVGGAKYTGNKSKQEIDNLIAIIEAYPLYKVEWESYEQGWFSSKGILVAGIELPQGNQFNELFTQMPKIRMAVDVKHGPLVMSDLGALGFASWQSTLLISDEIKAMLEFDNSSEIYQSSGIMTLNGGVEFTEHVPAITFKPEGEDGQLVLAGLDSKGSYDGETLTYNAVVPSVSFSDNKENASVNDITLDFSGKLDFQNFDPMDLYDFDFKATLAKITADVEEYPINIENLILAGSLALNDDGTSANMNLSYSLDKAEGPEFSLSNAVIDLDLLNYSREFNKRYNELSMSILSSPAMMPDAAQLQIFVLEGLPLLFAEKPELRVNSLRFTLDEGSFNSSASLKFSEMKDLQMNFSNPFYWLQNITLDAFAEADQAIAVMLAADYLEPRIRNTMLEQSEDPDEELIEQMATQQAPAILTMLGQQGMLVEREDKYEIKLALKDAQVMLNGTPMPLPF